MHNFCGIHAICLSEILRKCLIFVPYLAEILLHCRFYRGVNILLEIPPAKKYQQCHLEEKSEKGKEKNGGEHERKRNKEQRYWDNRS